VSGPDRPDSTESRRAKGEGSIAYDEREGLWVGRIEIPTGDGGRRRIKRKAKTKQAVAAKLRAVQGQLDRGELPINQRGKVGPWLSWWAEEVLPREVSAGTVTNYRNVLDSYVIPELGDVSLARLSGPAGAERVLSMMRALEKRDLSANTVRLARTVLRRALTDAERFGRITRNPVALTRSPRKTETKLDDALDVEEVETVLKAAEGDRLEALAVLVLTTGMRKGEAIALRWEDVNLDRASLRVRWAKTKAGYRTIALPPIVVDALRAHRARQRVERVEAWRWDDPGIVFATTIGTPLDGRNTLRWWHDLTTRAGVGRRRFHASRHTAATLMLNAGVSLEVVSATLGHAGLAITADVYAKVRPELQRTAATAMQDLLGGSGR